MCVISFCWFGVKHLMFSHLFAFILILFALVLCVSLCVCLVIAQIYGV